ncbi:hypothetical protein [Winogradskyella luteola]|uniref:Uncharacterized protein n=1 Tax=Winogradskyella luteola TaxID=2828330 RepID=A0A9X1F8A1_9FLAO|nr:hypothetical protein [Winogradskyella luteola]MBV7269161.1 hypothetical protein [Winogradskyella luteola]
MKKFIKYFLILIVATNCNGNEKSPTDNKVKEPKIVEIHKENKTKTDYFTLKLEAVVEEDDDFTLFYLNENQRQISKRNSVSIPVKGSDNYQTFFFQLNEDVLPNKLILKFGNKDKIQKIIVNSLELSYNGNKITITKQVFFNHFNPNEFIEYNKVNFTAVALEKEGMYNPFFVSRKSLQDRMNLELP